MTVSQTQVRILVTPKLVGRLPKRALYRRHPLTLVKAPTFREVFSALTEGTKCPHEHRTIEAAERCAARRA